MRFIFHHNESSKTWSGQQLHISCKTYSQLKWCGYPHEYESCKTCHIFAAPTWQQPKRRNCEYIFAQRLHISWSFCSARSDSQWHLTCLCLRPCMSQAIVIRVRSVSGHLPTHAIQCISHSIQTIIRILFAAFVNTGRIITRWNCRGFRPKVATFDLHMLTTGRPSNW